MSSSLRGFWTREISVVIIIAGATNARDRVREPAGERHWPRQQTRPHRPPGQLLTPHHELTDHAAVHCSNNLRLWQRKPKWHLTTANVTAVNTNVKFFFNFTTGLSVNFVYYIILTAIEINCIALSIISCFFYFLKQ